jgi:hypothetical protein
VEDDPDLARHPDLRKALHARYGERAKLFRVG